MTAVAAAPRERLTDEQLQTLLATVGKSDSVELKLTVADDERLTALRSLGIDPLDAEIRQVAFFDTPDLALSRAGVVVRARRSQAKGDDSTIKLRPVEPDALSADLRATPGFVVEVDAVPGAYVCSGSLSSGVKTGDVAKALRGERAIHKLFSREQRAFYADHAPAGLELDALSILGPIFVLKLRWSPDQFAHRTVAEAWLFPDASITLELSTKTTPSDALRTAVDARAFLTRNGVSLASGQETKTHRALRMFSQRLDGAAG